MQGRFFRLNAHFNGKSELGEGRKDSREAFGGNYVSRSYFVLMYEERRRTRESSYGEKESKVLRGSLKPVNKITRLLARQRVELNTYSNTTRQTVRSCFIWPRKKVWDQVLSSVVIAFVGHVRIYCLIALFTTLFKSPLINQSGTHGLPF